MLAGGGASSSRLHLLELTVISAQDLHHRRLGRRVRAYAVAWADYAEHRLRTEVDVAGGPDPTWNDRFLFRVDAGFLRSETAAITVEVRAVRRLRMIGADAVLGRTRIVVSTFVRPSGPGMFSPSSATGRHVVALQLRRPRSLRPQGILNVAVTLLDGANARTMAPICSAPGSPDAFAVKDLVTMRQAASLCEITEEEEEAEPGFQRRPRVVEYSGPLDAKGAAIEQRKLEMTLEKWRADLSPGRKDDSPDPAGSPAGRKRRRRRSSCFGSTDWDR